MLYTKIMMLSRIRGCVVCLLCRQYTGGGLTWQQFVWNAPDINGF
jgi:hypothetical protein